ncbi:hypothetical protein Tco_0328258 [Tanacetum coccineum]
MSIQDMEDLKQQYLDEMKSLINEIQIKDYRDEKIDVEIKINELKENFNGMNDEEEYTIAITPVLPTEEPNKSLSMGDEHLSTIPETESDELIKSSVENLVPIPSESEDFSDIESDDDESFSNEDVSKEIYSNPLFDEEIISTKIDPHHFNAESDLIESLLNQDTSIISSPKINSLLKEFSEIRLVEKLLYDNSSPRPLEELNFENSDAVIESFSPSPIFVEDSDSLMEEIDIFLPSDDSIPPGELYVHVPNVLTTLPTLSSMFDTLLLFSSENKNKVFNYSILASNEEKSPHLLSHRGFKAFQIIFDFSESPMMIYGGDSPILDVPFLHFYPP